MRTLSMIFAVLVLTGCAQVQSWIPSFWDANQSARVTDLQLAVDRLDCAGDQLTQVTVIRDHLRWFELYSRSKGSTQQDVMKMITPMQETVQEWHTRVAGGRGSRAYCELKQRVMQQQAGRAAAAVQGRW